MRRHMASLFHFSQPLNRSKMCGWKWTPPYARGVTHTDSFIAMCYNKRRVYMLQDSLFRNDFFFTFILWKWNGKKKKQQPPPEALNKKKTLDLVLRVQIKAETLHCVKDTVRPWQAAVYCIVCFLPPSPAPVLKQSKQIKVLQGITSQNTARFAVNMISANVRNHRAQETYVGSDSNKSSLSAKYQSKIECARERCAHCLRGNFHEPMYANASSLSPVNLSSPPPPRA